MAFGYNNIKMSAPICLINNTEDGGLEVCGEALEILDQITQPVVVVAVVGLYRTGKSYLMNRLAGKQTGFALGNTIESKTKGIWMWCVPHPQKKDHTLVLLDTEGLGDVDKGDEKHDVWIFCMAVLLSSTLVYNSLGTIDNTALEKLHYVAKLTENIKVNSNPKNDKAKYNTSTEFMRVFPSFVWAVRDFILKLELNGKPITADEYLENALKLKPGDSTNDVRNKTRSSLRDFFAVRKCFVFERPANSKKMMNMESLTDADLEEDFVTEANTFCSYIYHNSNPKTMRGGLEVTGRKEQLRREALDQQNRYLEEQRKIQEQQIRDQQRAQQEYAEQLRKKTEEENAHRREEMQRRIAAEHEEQMRIMEQRCEKEIQMMQMEIYRLQLQNYNNPDPLLATLAQTYVEAISSGQVPSLDNAVESLTQIHNSRALTEAVDFYRSEMIKKVKFPTETQQEFSDLHSAVEKEAISVFIRGSFNDLEQTYQKELKTQLEHEYGELVKQNIEESRKLSRSVISQVFGPLEEELSQGTFLCPGGYSDFCRALERAIQQYKREKGLGLMSKEVLAAYLKEKNEVGSSILSADRSLSEAEQKIQEEKLKRDALEQQNKYLEEQRTIQEQLIKDQQKSHEEHIQQLKIKMEEENERSREEIQRTLDAQHKEQLRSMEEGFREKGLAMQRQMDELKEEQNKKGFFEKIGGAVLSVLDVPEKLVTSVVDYFMDL